MKLKRIISIALSLLIASLLLASCGEETDDSKEQLKLISTAADITEILGGLGLNDAVVAADTYSSDVSGISAEICTLDYMNPNIEAILGLSPDVVFVSGSSTDGTVDPYSALKDSGVNVVYIPTALSIDGIKENIALIADAVDKKDESDKLIKEIDDAVANAKAKADGLEKVSVYFEIGAAPWLYSFGSGTFLNDIITICGGENIYAEQSGWLSNTEESVLTANPSVIITNVMYDGYDSAEILSRPGWDTIDAVKNSRVVSVDANASSRGSQNIVKAIEEISKAIHPEAYGN